MPLIAHHSLWDTILSLWWATHVLEVSGMVCLNTFRSIVSCVEWEYLLMFSSLYHSFHYYISYSSHKKSSICINKTFLSSSWIFYKLIYLLGKRGNTQSLRHIPRRTWKLMRKPSSVFLCLSKFDFFFP